MNVCVWKERERERFVVNKIKRNSVCIFDIFWMQFEQQTYTRAAMSNTYHTRVVLPNFII